MQYPMLFPSSILDNFWPEGLLSQCHIFLPFHTVHGVLVARILEWQEYWSAVPFPPPVDHILSELSTTTHCDPLWPYSVLGGPALHGSQLHWVTQTPSSWRAWGPRLGTNVRALNSFAQSLKSPNSYLTAYMCVYLVLTKYCTNVTQLFLFCFLTHARIPSTYYKVKKDWHVMELRAALAFLLCHFQCKMRTDTLHILISKVTQLLHLPNISIY